MDAEDVTQQVFIKAWRSRDRFDRERGLLASWLVGITKHVISDERGARDRDRRLAQRTATLAPLAGEPWSTSGNAVPRCRNRQRGGCRRSGLTLGWLGAVRPSEARGTHTTPDM
jgi:DNA-directed RNA polymerase specialized sigma24 family protein